MTTSKTVIYSRAGLTFAHEKCFQCFQNNAKELLLEGLLSSFSQLYWIRVSHRAYLRFPAKSIKISVIFFFGCFSISSEILFFFVSLTLFWQKNKIRANSSILPSVFVLYSRNGGRKLDHVIRFFMHSILCLTIYSL